MKDKLIEKIKPYLAGYSAYLTGGYIRDGFSNDRDIAINCKNLKQLCENIAADLGGIFVKLDDDNKIYRVVFGENYVDFAYFENLNEDIDRRDFTINSIMYDINTGKIFDKNGGKIDYKNKLIRTFKLSNLSDDYLRMLRAYRFQAVLGFKIDDEISRFIKSNANKLELAAPERIQQELFKIFSGNFLPQTILDMDKTGLLEVIFPVFNEIKKIPPNTHHHLDLFHHCVETMKNIRINKPELKLAALLHDLAKPDCWTIEPESGRHRFIGHDEAGGKKVVPILKKLKFPNQKIEYISKMIKYHIYPSALMGSSDKTQKSIIRFVRKIGEDTPDLIELARADRLCARGAAVTDEMIKENLKNLELLLEKYEQIAPKLRTLPKLIDGVEIMKILQIPPSPKLREIIEEIKERQLEGIINSEAEAKNYVLGLKKRFNS